MLMKGIIGGLPKEIDEAAMVDGGGRFRVIFTIITPVILPGIVATAAFAFIGCWNEFGCVFFLDFNIEVYHSNWLIILNWSIQRSMWLSCGRQHYWIYSTNITFHVYSTVLDPRSSRGICKGIG
ncbi:ABC transporter permease subunit [Paenibacillus sp. LMG 31461]|uniref:ABC transporter permease subunit n=1 Tax=Paenibacillus plantarum TaxID=2654975 RepID=A0ABX1X580_9BACL|nr:ABC transporter permease subunit [Paenibacillus plantarum]